MVCIYYCFVKISPQWTDFEVNLKTESFRTDLQTRIPFYAERLKSLEKSWIKGDMIEDDKIMLYNNLGAPSEIGWEGEKDVVEKIDRENCFSLSQYTSIEVDEK